MKLWNSSLINDSIGNPVPSRWQTDLNSTKVGLYFICRQMGNANDVFTAFASLAKLLLWNGSLLNVEFYWFQHKCDTDSVQLNIDLGGSKK